MWSHRHNFGGNNLTKIYGMRLVITFAVLFIFGLVFGICGFMNIIIVKNVPAQEMQCNILLSKNKEIDLLCKLPVSAISKF